MNLSFFPFLNLWTLRFLRGVAAVWLVLLCALIVLLRLLLRQLGRFYVGHLLLG